MHDLKIIQALNAQAMGSVHGGAVTKTLIDAAEKWAEELGGYLIPSTAVTSAENAKKYTAERERIMDAVKFARHAPIGASCSDGHDNSSAEDGGKAMVGYSDIEKIHRLINAWDDAAQGDSSDAEVDAAVNMRDFLQELFMKTSKSVEAEMIEEYMKSDRVEAVKRHPAGKNVPRPGDWGGIAASIARGVMAEHFDTFAGRDVTTSPSLIQAIMEVAVGRGIEHSARVDQSARRKAVAVKLPNPVNVARDAYDKANHRSVKRRGMFELSTAEFGKILREVAIEAQKAE